MAQIKLEDVTKRFGKVEAVKRLNLTVEDGEFVTLVGPSGCGKSTTLNLVAGLENPTTGYIYIDDEIANILPPAKRDVAMVFQSYALYPHMNVFDNMAFGLRIRGMRGDEIRKRVDDVARLLGLHELLDRKPAELSGGQRQRVALGRAIVRNPKVFLLDEPLSNLDAKLRVQMRADLRLLFKRLRGTVIYVTHDQEEAMTLSDRIVVMNMGVVQQIGRPDELYDRPKNMFVAGFLGSPPMNFIDCVVEERNDGGWLQTESFEVRIPEEKLYKIKTMGGAKELVIGIRPEDIILGQPGCSIECIIETIENKGSGCIIYLRTDSTRIICTTERRSDLPIGGNVKVGFRLDNLHVFDKKTEQAAF
ncbi:MAG: ABC transporter ATP-binding protein [Actinobacteria bacterium]|nr:ABC transporter ATP-binding protein [Actinomycetota bacterium]